MRLLQTFDANAALFLRCGAQSMTFAVELASPLGAFDRQWQTASRDAHAPGLQHVAAAAYMQPLEPPRPDSWRPPAGWRRGYRNFKRPFSRRLNVSDACQAVKRASDHGKPMVRSTSLTILWPNAPDFLLVGAFARASVERLSQR